MALLAGRRAIAEIERFGQSLTQPLRQRSGLPKKRDKGIRRMPGYAVHYGLLARIGPGEFNKVLNHWLEAHASDLPRALAVDGKMVSNHFGILSRARHSDGALGAMSVFDENERTERCEQTVAAQLVDETPALGNRVITADALHCQRELARAIVENGGG